MQIRSKRFKAAITRGRKLGLTMPEARILARLDTPERIQDFITRIPMNFEPDGDTCLSVREVLRQRRAHCVEAAFVAACAFWMQGERPLVVDMQASDIDDDHVIAVFKRGGGWGAISKSNGPWLRYRDPIYRSLRELAMSYFPEYNKGPLKTLRTYSLPFDMRRLKPAQWITREGSCWEVVDTIDASRHFKLLTPAQAKHLRHRDRTELRTEALKEYRKPGHRKTHI
ncbi:MAG: hypothetical protein SFV19_14550 [Rhodospirillaceae bacterium]|nr:hypothetical protein [Rhodospirillaceae bacterium]